MTKTWRPGKEEWERIKTAAHNRILKERGLPLSDDDYIEVGADAMLEILQRRLFPINIEADWGRTTDSNIPQPESFCKFPGCSSKSIAAHGYCQGHYKQLNKVT